MTAKLEEKENRNVVKKSISIDDPDDRSLVVGPGGRTINTITKKHNVKIDVPSKTDIKGIVTVSGSSDNVEKALDEIGRVLKGEQEEEREDLVRKTVIVYPDERHIVVGPEGRTERELRKKFGVRIDIPHKDSDEIGILVSGSLEENVNAAIDAIVDLAEAQKNVEEGLKVYRHERMIVVGPGGATVKALTRRFNVRIHVPDRASQDDRVIIRGHRDDVEDVIKEILDMLDEFHSKKRTGEWRWRE